MKYLKLFDAHSEYESKKDNLILPNVSFCVLQNEVHYNPYVDPYNNYDYVDLGLPSGTKWATMNVGASNETDKGLFFAWGDVEGVYEDGDISKFTTNNYKFTQIDRDDQGHLLRRYCYKYNYNDKINILELTDDPARVNMGGLWRTPTKTECDELINNTLIEFVYNYKNTNVYGYLFTSLINGNKIFFPNSYAIFGDGTWNPGYVVQLQTSERNPNEKESYYYYLFTISHDTSNGICHAETWDDSYYRQYGLNIRAVV